jgi:hypothetical protein
VKELVVFLYRQTVGSGKLLTSGSGEGIPNCGSVDDTVIASGSVPLLDDRFFIQALKRRGTAELVWHIFSFNGVHNLLRGAAEKACKIQWPFLFDGEESFLNYAGIPARVTGHPAAKAEADMTGIVESVAKKRKAPGADVLI